MSETVPPMQTLPSAASHSRPLEILCHITGALGLLVMPLNFAGPLVIWLLKRNESLGVDAHGKEALNFHISWSIYLFVLGMITAILFVVVIGIFLVPVLILMWVAMVVLGIIASVKASNGELYRYPLTIRFLN